MVAARPASFGASNCEKQAFILTQRLGRGAGIPAKAAMPEKIFAGQTAWPTFSAKRKTIFFAKGRTIERKHTPPLEIAFTRFQ